MPLLQLLWNLPLLLLGFGVKAAFFAKKGFGKEYIAGIKNGIALSAKGKRNGKKVKFDKNNLTHYLCIQWELYVNILRRVL